VGVFIVSDTTATNDNSNTGKHKQFEQVVLVLQGGGALGSYQAGVYQALAEADLHPDWVAGISIGAINSALIAGNPPAKRVERLREFWETVTESALGVPYFKSLQIHNDYTRQALNQAWAANILMFGVPNFFVPRMPPPVLWPSSEAGKASYYDISPLQATLNRLVDFDLLNSGAMRFSVGAVQVDTGNFAYFDTTDSTADKIRAEHILASGSLPPGFPATKIGDKYYWDGGLVSNTPLQWVFDSRPRLDRLVFQVDLWNARGIVPKDLIGVEVRQKEIVYSSRTRAATDQYKNTQKLRIAVANLIKKLPEELRDSEDVKLLASEANDKVCNIVHLIYRARSYEGVAKDFEFSRRTMEEHWKSGYENAKQTLAAPDIMQLPDRAEGVKIFDVCKSD
jgi:NTE family protein